MTHTGRDTLSGDEQRPGAPCLGGARLALMHIGAGFWVLRRQMEALVGQRLANRVLQQAGTNSGVSFAHAFASHVAADSPAQALRDCVAAYQAAGFGSFEIEVLEWPFTPGRDVGAQDKPTSSIRIRGTDTIETRIMQQHSQEAQSPVCSFTAGVLMGFVNAVSDCQDVVCVERACQAQGDEACLFEISPFVPPHDTPAVAFDLDPLPSYPLNLLEVLFNRMPMGIAIFDRDLVLRRCNPTWAEYIEQYTPTAASQVVPGASLFELAPGTEPSFGPVFARALAGETVQLEGLRSDSGGIVSYWDAVVAPLVEDGQVVGVVDVTIDATERMLAYQTLEQRIEERTREVERRRLVAEGLRDILDSLNSELSREEILRHIASQARRLLDADACLIYRLEQNNQWMVVESECGLPADYGTLRAGPVHPTTIAQAILNYQPAAITDLPAYVATHPPEERVQFIEFHRRWSQVASKHFRSALGVPLIVKETLYGGMVFYYRERREFLEEDSELGVMLGDQAALMIENARLRAQAELLAVVKERERLARDLHDSVTQSLYSLVLLAEAGQRLIGAGDMERAEEALGRLGEIGQQALKEMRLLVYELRPLALKREGLVGALRHRLDTVERRAGVETNLLVEGSVRLAESAAGRVVEEGLYRIVQEALNNALKHSAATSVTVQVRARDEWVEIEIVDDGKGFDLNAVTNDGGIGLASMRERAERMGATLTILSAPGKGTRVVVSMGTMVSLSPRSPLEVSND